MTLPQPPNPLDAGAPVVARNYDAHWCKDVSQSNDLTAVANATVLGMGGGGVGGVCRGESQPHPQNRLQRASGGHKVAMVHATTWENPMSL